MYLHVVESNLLNIFIYTEKNTPNPINALKLTNYNTTRTNNTKIHFWKSKQIETCSKCSKSIPIKNQNP